MVITPEMPGVNCTCLTYSDMYIYIPSTVQQIGTFLFTFEWTNILKNGHTSGMTSHHPKIPHEDFLASEHWNYWHHDRWIPGGCQGHLFLDVYLRAGCLASFRFPDRPEVTCWPQQTTIPILKAVNMTFQFSIKAACRWGFSVILWKRIWQGLFHSSRIRKTLIPCPKGHPHLRFNIAPQNVTRLPKRLL